MEKSWKISMDVELKKRCFPATIWSIRAMWMPNCLPEVSTSIRWISLDLFSLIRVGQQKKLDALITATFSSIGKPKVFAVQQDRKVEIGVRSLRDMESPDCGYGSLFLSVELVLFILNVHKLRPKYLCCVQMNRPITPSNQGVNVRKRLNFAPCMQRERVLKVQLLKVSEPVRYEDLGIWG
jgi:hypothetical protein